MHAPSRDTLFKELQRHLNAFLAYNRTKTELCLSLFSQTQKDAFQLIPYLLNCSLPKKFSYEGDACAPSGIISYRQPQGLQQLCQKYFGKQENYDLRSSDPTPAIEFLSIMGSIGSVAYTDKSDLDYWCCIKETLDQDQRLLLQLKFNKIEAWCEKELGVEVHFFMTTANQLKHNDFGEVSDESCGSALGKLLKEEYYRGSLHLYGKIPLWWTVPSGTTDHDYDQLYEMIESSPKTLTDFVIDIGNLHEIPRQEFLGGGLWQLNKGIHSPFKSILKLGLLIAYADTEQKQPLISESLKSLVQNNLNSSLNFDPYCEMVDFILDYFDRKGESDYVKLFQICFFSKVHQQVSNWFERDKVPNNPNAKTMLAYVKKWEWTKKETEQWEDLRVLSLQQNLKLKKDVESFMLFQFQNLVKSIQASKVTSIISMNDLNRLLNRLKTIYDPTRKRIEWLYPPFQLCVKSKTYSLIQTDTGHWRLYKSEIDWKKPIAPMDEKSFIRSSLQLEDQCLWLIYNGFIQLKTKLFTNSPKAEDLCNNLKVLKEVYQQHFYSPKIPSLDLGGFDKPPKSVAWLFSINLIPSHDVDLAPASEPDSERDLNTLFIRNEEETPQTPKSNHVQNVLKTFKPHETEETQLDTQHTVINNNLKPIAKQRALGSHEDPLNATINKTNLIHSLLIVSKNNWGEVNFKNFTGEMGLLKSIIHFLEQAHHCPQIDFSCLEFHSGQDAFDPRQLSQRIKQLFNQILYFFILDSSSSSIPKFFFIELAGVTYCIEYCDGSYRFKSYLNLHQASIYINLNFPMEIRLGFDQKNRAWEFFNQALLLHRSGMIHCTFQKGQQHSKFLVIDEWKHFSFFEIETGELRANFPRFVQSIITCKFGILELNHLATIAASLKIYTYSKQRFEDCTQRTLDLLQPSLQRLKKVDLQIPFEDGMIFLQSFSEKGRYIFDSELLKKEIKYGLKEIFKLRKSTGLNRHYPVFFNQFQLLPDENEFRYLNSALILNLKLGLERACQLVFIRS